MKTIQANELKNQLDHGVRYQLVDVRSPQEYSDGHVPGALNLPMEEAEARIEDLSRQSPVVLVCQSGNRAEMTCELLAQHHDQLIVLEGGTDAWQDAGLPIVGGSRARLPLMRQVQLIAGSLVLAGVVLSYAIDPKWALLSGFVGLGLTFAGATGWCGMAMLLRNAPWNRPATPDRRPAVEVQR